jgi:phospholipid/cholesterol/gamma-HCH transport system substrate-binding protein
VTNEERTDIKVGITVLAGIALLLFGIGWAKGWNTAGHEIRYQAAFQNAGGLELGDPVTLKGVKRGIVRKVEARQSDVLVTMGFSEKLDLHEDASASISMLELMTGKKVELHPGTSPKPLPPNAIIPGVFAGDISSLVEMVTSLSGSLESISKKADTMFTSINGIMDNDSLKHKINRTLDEASTTMRDINGTANRASTFMDQNGPLLAQTLTEGDSTLQILNSIARENRAGLRVLVDSGGQAVADARHSLARLDSMLASSERKNSLLYKLVHDDGFAVRLDSVVISLTKLSEQLRLQGLDANIRFWNSSKPVK